MSTFYGERKMGHISNGEMTLIKKEKERVSK